MNKKLDETGVLVMLDTFRRKYPNSQIELQIQCTTEGGIYMDMAVPFCLSGMAIVNDKIEAYSSNSSHSSYFSFTGRGSLDCQIVYNYEKGYENGKISFKGVCILVKNINGKEFFQVIDSLPQLIEERRQNRAELHEQMADANSGIPKEVWESIDNMME